jgi:hypothetical protein
VAVKCFASCATAFIVASCASLGGLTAQVTTNWWQTGGASACGYPAAYRINGGSLHELGDCAAYLIEPPTKVTLKIGGVLDVHITQEASGDSGSQLVPIYPIPSSTNTSVLVATAVSDGGSSESFEAVGAGSASMTTVASCLVSSTVVATDKRCPVLLVVVP